MGSRRLFVAVWPSERVLDVLGSLTDDRSDDEAMRWMPRQNWHITLRFLGDAPVDEVLDRLERAPLPAATATIGPTVRQLGRNALVVPVHGLGHLAHVVRDATADLGRPVGSRTFNGHLTVARLRAGSTSSVVGTPVRAEFDVVEVALVSSTTLPSGAVYETLGRMPTA